jgi:ABC-type Na+ efflux pump permease subunit
MKTKIVAVLLTGILLAFPVGLRAADDGKSPLKQFIETQRQQAAAFRQQEITENRAFRETLKGKSKQEKIEALKQFRSQQKQERKAFLQNQHDRLMAFLRERLAGSTNLTEQQKADLLAFFETQYQENMAFYDQQCEETLEFFEKTINDTGLTAEQKKAAIRDFLKEKREQAKQYRSQQKQERKNKLDSLRPKKTAM